MITFTWTDPTTNVDDTPITAGEITGYNLGFRLESVGAPGTYSEVVGVPGASAASETMSSIVPTLPPGAYAAAIQTVGPLNSAWSAEITFTVLPPQPSAPTGFKLG